MILVPGKGKDVLVDLINQQNVLPSPLKPDEVIFTTPKFVQGPLPTLVTSTVIPVPDSAYEGMVPVQYERMDLTSAFGDYRPRITGLSNGNLHSMLPFIGKELGISLEPEDFEQVDYSWLGEDEEVNIPLIALSTSLSYIGKFSVQFTRRRIKLEEAIKITDLDVHTHPGITVATLSKKPVTLFTYSRDWSEYYSAIQRHRLYNIAGNASALRNLMSSLGFSNWPVGWNNPMLDRPTSAVPESNKDYDRVITMEVKDKENIGQILPYAGLAYFHYNVIS